MVITDMAKVSKKSVKSTFLLIFFLFLQPSNALCKKKKRYLRIKTANYDLVKVK